MLGAQHVFESPFEVRIPFGYAHRLLYCAGIADALCSGCAAVQVKATDASKTPDGSSSPHKGSPLSPSVAKAKRAVPHESKCAFGFGLSVYCALRV